MERKERAIILRQQGKSYREIEKELGIARSTLSYWLNSIQISKIQSDVLRERWVEGTANARRLGSIANKLAKVQRLANIDKDVRDQYLNQERTFKELEMLFIGLYLGDGFKVEGRLGLGNADPGIVLSFVILVEKLYKVQRRELKAQIFARSDQNVNELVNYWARLLNISVTQFYKTQIDLRSRGKSTRENYYGVCAVSYNSVILHRKILAICKEMIKYVSTL